MRNTLKKLVKGINNNNNNQSRQTVNLIELQGGQTGEDLNTALIRQVAEQLEIERKRQKCFLLKTNYYLFG
jgi:hypothetical protein